MKKRLFVDKEICTGCRYCEFVCSLVHNPDNQVNPEKARISVHQDCFRGLFTPTICRQCKKAPCAEACVFDAIVADPQLGIPWVDSEKCTACMACLEACPFGAVSFDHEHETAIKCDLCGGEPKCAKFCRALPHVGRSALTYMTAEEWVRRKRDGISERRRKGEVG